MIVVSLIAAAALVAMQTWVVRKTGSTAIAADRAHYMTDIVVNTGVLAALGISKLTGWDRADPAIAFIISGYIMWNAYHIAANVLTQLLDHEIPEADRQLIQAAVLACSGVRAVHDLRTRDAGDRTFVEFHLEVDGNLTVTQGHAIGDAAEISVGNLFPATVEVTAHLEPFGIGVAEVTATILDRHPTSTDLERLAIAMRSSPHAIRRMTFVGQPAGALEFVAHRAPIWTCAQCAREFASQGPFPVLLRQWFVAVASLCRRCGGQLTPSRAYTARAIHDIIAAGDLYGHHAFVCERLTRAFDDVRPIGAVTRAMRALAAPLPINNRVLYRARRRGCLPSWTDQTPPLLWQLVGTRRLRRHVPSYRYWRPPARRPYAAWPLVGQIITTVGLTVLAEPGTGMWGILRDLRLVEPGDELVVRDILANVG